MRLEDSVTPVGAASLLCVRLSNDLRTAERERLEGNINAITIKSRLLCEAGLIPDSTEHAATAEVERELEAALAECTRLAAQIHTATGHTEAAFAAVAHLTRDFYRRRDFTGRQAAD